MKRIALFLVAIATVAVIVAFTAHASGQPEAQIAPVFGIKIPSGYRNWRLISVAHEAGNLNDLRAILGNEIAIKAYREQKLPFPDGAIIARLAWSYVPSEENTKSSVVNNLSSPDLLQTFSSWSRTPKNTPPPAAGASLSSKTANLPTRPRTRPVFPATSQ